MIYLTVTLIVIQSGVQTLS